MVEILCTQRGSITSYGALSGRRLLLILPCCRARTGPDVEPERGQSTPPMRCQRRRICCGDSAGSPVRHRKGVSSQHNRVRNILAEQSHGLTQFVIAVFQERDSVAAGRLTPGDAHATGAQPADQAPSCVGSADGESSSRDGGGGTPTGRAARAVARRSVRVSRPGRCRFRAGCAPRPPRRRIARAARAATR